ncbi:MAG: PucR family transcriptional regulator ligand-binding domain-containing protein [Eubacteriales bacterium]|nr:PucR family transcriptional regulator ligand-binding domain-containing protein [Eubacteriales bacterium]
MAYTLLQLISSDLLSRIRQITPYQDLTRRFVSSISVQELPVDDFIRENELVLSTAAGYEKNASVLPELVQKVGSADASALFLTFKQKTDIPDSVLSIAESYSLPVFLIPWEIPFSKIIDEVSREIASEKTLIFQQLQNRLLNLFYEGHAMEEAIAILRNTLHTEILLTGSDLKPISASPEIAEEISAENAEEDHQAAADLLADSDYLSVPISAGKIDAGFLYIKKGNSEPLLQLTEHPEFASRYFSLPLSLWFHRITIERQTELRLRSDFVRELAAGTDRTREECEQQAARLGFQLSLPYTCIVFRLRNMENPNPDLLETIEKKARDLAEKEHLHIMISSQVFDTVLYLENRTDHPEDEISAFLDQWETALSNSYPSLSFCFGISEISKDTPDFQELFHNASMAVRLAESADEKRFRYQYQDTLEAKIVALFNDDTEIRTAAEKMLAPLHNDRKNGPDLIRTLIMYISCDLNAAKTAAALHLHRQSLLYRLKRIEQATGLSLSNHRDLFLLEIATRIFYPYPPEAYRG